MFTRSFAMQLLVFLPLLAACSTSPERSGSDAAPSCSDVARVYDPEIVPGSFTTKVDNPYYPLVPGTIQKTIDTDGNVTRIVVTSETKKILGVECVVVHDYATTSDGLLLEDTFDYFAQDEAGNVWYFGEDTKAYTGAVVSPAGSWVGGVECARPGIVMKARPAVGDSYRQEYLPGSAEDQADVLALDETVTVPYGTFQHCVETKDYTALEPGKAENKWYCAGVGNVLTIDLVTVGTAPREELVSVDGATGSGAPPEPDAGGVDAGPGR
jgi:hypothetical protein